MQHLLKPDIPPLEHGLKTPHCSPVPACADEQNQCVKLYPLLLASVERFTVQQSYAACLSIQNPDQRRDLALIRRVDAGQLCILDKVLSLAESHSERLLSSFLLILTLAAHMAQRSEENQIQSILDFLLPEYQDMIYRLANSMIASGKKDVINHIGGFAEIMPGKPMIACHRHPYDDVAEPLAGINASDRMALIMIAAAEEAIANQLHFCIQETDIIQEKELYFEFFLITEQHLSLITSLIADVSPLQTLLDCHFAEAFLYASCAQTADNPRLRQFYLDEMNLELAHVNKVLEMISSETGRPIELPAFPPPLQLTPQKGYVRDTLKNMGVTLRRGKCVPVGSLKKGADFFRYQKRICPVGTQMPSHQLIMKIIQANGMDFRHEIAPHPIQALRDRETDRTDIGR